MSKQRGLSDAVQGRWARVGAPVGSHDLEERMIVTYRDDADGRVRVLEGAGPTLREALDAADAQLPRGVWRRLACSTVHSIYRDLVNDGMPLATGYTEKYAATGLDKRGANFLKDSRQRGEGGTVIVP